jgi:hypothetical protein
MPAAVRALWRTVRPGGTLAITTFGDQVWEPVLTHFVEAAGRARPDIERIVPWRRTERRDIHEEMMREAGVPGSRTEHQIDEIPFRPDDWPLIVMGSGLRRIAVDLGEQATEVIRGSERWARDRGLTSVRISALHTTAVKRP